MIGMLLNVVHRQVHKKTFNKGVERASRLFLSITRNTCIPEPREARAGGHKMSGMEGGENWSKCTCVI